MRFTDLSKDRFTDFQPEKRSTECSETTKNSTYSGISLATSQSGISSSDSDMAQLLLGLANEIRCDDKKSDKMED